LLHSQAQWRVQAGEPTPDSLPAEEARHVLPWFMPKKRGLLVPFAVGTVDQALLGVLLTRHFFVRLFGLGRKLVISDEVHDYDTYMRTLFERLLDWLSAIGTSVITRSATLPERTRRPLVAAYAGEGLQALPDSSGYPRLTVTGLSTAAS